MNPQDFCFWLDGFLEGKTTLTQDEISKIEETLQKVFCKVTSLETFSVGGEIAPRTRVSYC